jgi:hypothetical protein
MEIQNVFSIKLRMNKKKWPPTQFTLNCIYGTYPSLVDEEGSWVVALMYIGEQEIARSKCSQLYTGKETEMLL